MLFCHYLFTRQIDAINIIPDLTYPFTDDDGVPVDELLLLSLHASVDFAIRFNVAVNYYKVSCRINATPRVYTYTATRVVKRCRVCCVAYLMNVTMNNENFKSSPKRDESDLISLEFLSRSNKM